MSLYPDGRVVAELRREFIAPQWASNVDVHLAHRPQPEQLANMRAAAAACDEHNAAAYQRWAERFATFCKEAEEMLGSRSPAMRSIEKNRPYPSCRKWVAFLDEQGRKWDAAERAQAEEAKKRQANVEQAALLVRAVDWLRAHGKELGRDFEAANAIETANEIAFEEECARQKEDAPLEFSGDDNCEGCAGWDGESRRCECGNRRVGWSRHDWHTFEKPAIYAEAW